jgi:hypothetical protein
VTLLYLAKFSVKFEKYIVKYDKKCMDFKRLQKSLSKKGKKFYAYHTFFYVPFPDCKVWKLRTGDFEHFIVNR